MVYKARKNTPEYQNKFQVKAAKFFTKFFSPTKASTTSPNQEVKQLTRVEQDLLDMDEYYIIYNHELPDQQIMTLPPKRQVLSPPESKSPKVQSKSSTLPNSTIIIEVEQDERSNVTPTLGVIIENRSHLSQ